MGMAASQARFLGLTARKSNVEYQGQQVNQQRTALANESANLYNKMMALSVPTPPAKSDYYTTTYELEDSQASYSEENYTFQNAVKTYGHEGEYSVTLINKKDVVQNVPSIYPVGTINVEEVTDKEATDTEEVQKHKVYTIPLLTNKTTSSYRNIVYDESGLDAYDANGVLTVDPMRIYKVNNDKQLIGKETCCDPDTAYYFYQDEKGNNHFIKQEELDAFIQDPTLTGSINEAYANVYHKDVQTQVTGTMEKSKTGRFSSIRIDNNEDYPDELRGKTFALNVKQIYDETAYDDAMNDYEYQKDVYEQTISEINAKTEIVQRQDQKLELRLDQLDTEQNAIKTEMDAVQKVLKDNVEKTFKTFNA